MNGTCRESSIWRCSRDSENRGQPPQEYFDVSKGNFPKLSGRTCLTAFEVLLEHWQIAWNEFVVR